MLEALVSGQKNFHVELIQIFGLRFLNIFKKINDFLKTHQKDIVDGADPEEEFMNYAMVNDIQL